MTVRASSISIWSACAARPRSEDCSWLFFRRLLLIAPIIALFFWSLAAALGLFVLRDVPLSFLLALIPAVRASQRDRDLSDAAIRRRPLHIPHRDPDPARRPAVAGLVKPQSGRRPDSDHRGDGHPAHRPDECPTSARPARPAATGSADAARMGADLVPRTGSRHDRHHHHPAVHHAQAAHGSHGVDPTARRRHGSHRAPVTDQLAVLHPRRVAEQPF